MHALYFVRYIYCLFVVVSLFKKKKKKKTEKKSRSAVSRSVVPPFRVPSFRGLLTTVYFHLFMHIETFAYKEYDLLPLKFHENNEHRNSEMIRLVQKSLLMIGRLYIVDVALSNALHHCQSAC